MYDEESDDMEESDDTEEDVVRPIDEIQDTLLSQGYVRWEEITARNYPQLAAWGVVVRESYPTIQRYITVTFGQRFVDIFQHSEYGIQNARSVEAVEEIFIQNARSYRAPIRI